MDDWDKDNPRSPEFCGTKNLINRVEFIRVIEQALVRLGFRELANQLEAQSVSMPNTDVAQGFTL